MLALLETEYLDPAEETRPKYGKLDTVEIWQ